MLYGGYHLLNGHNPFLGEGWIGCHICCGGFCSSSHFWIWTCFFFLGWFILRFTMLIHYSHFLLQDCTWEGSYHYFMFWILFFLLMAYHNIIVDDENNNNFIFSMWKLTLGYDSASTWWQMLDEVELTCWRHEKCVVNILFELLCFKLQMKLCKKYWICNIYYIESLKFGIWKSI
jgi:hypothetical protein